MSAMKSSVIGILLAGAIGTGAINFISQPPLTPESEIQGHFTVKFKPESVWIVPPELNADKTGCAVKGDCAAQLDFSDVSVPHIIVKNCIGGKLVNLGDLDNDGLDEIGLLPDWFATDCWRQYLVYTYKNGKWKYAVSPFDTHCNQWKQKLPPIVKDPNQPGNVIITYSTTEGNDIVSKTKSVSVK